MSKKESTSNPEDEAHRMIIEKFSSAEESGYVKIPTDLKTSEEFVSWLHEKIPKEIVVGQYVLVIPDQGRHPTHTVLVHGLNGEDYGPLDYFPWSVLHDLYQIADKSKMDIAAIEIKRAAASCHLRKLREQLEGNEACVNHPGLLERERPLALARRRVYRRINPVTGNLHGVGDDTFKNPPIVILTPNVNGGVHIDNLYGHSLHFKGLDDALKYLLTEYGNV